MFDRKRWIVSEQDPSCVKKLADSLGTNELCAKLLINRGYTDVESACAFIEKSDAFLYNPFLLKDIKPATARIRRAIEDDEKITIYGDYDVDGVTSVSVLFMYLREHGADVDYYIPTRDGEGYGVSSAAFRTIKEHGTGLVITVDTGITAIDEIAYAQSIGLDVIVTDHHQCRQELPVCEAVVNPQRPDCEYPFKELSGVGVIFKVLCALELELVNYGEYNLFTIKDMCRRYIDLVTIGTIADVMPLCDENRIMVYMGLGMLSSTRNIGVRELFRAVGLDASKKITASMIGYTVAPKINAAGRIGNASRAVQLFLATSPHAARAIAEELCMTNRERQQTEASILAEAMSQIENEHDLEKESVLVLASDSWHQGVIGIVASRITEQFGKPAILISFDAGAGEHGLGKGSARSVKGLNIVEALASCEHLLVKYGGHELAAGLSIEREKLSEFRVCLNDYVASHLSSPEYDIKTTVEAEIQETDVTEETVREISKLEPYGAKNPEPIFVFRNVFIKEIAPLSQGKHSRLLVEKNGKAISAVCFGYHLAAEGFSAGDCVDIVCGLGINEFRGNKKLQLIVKDIDYAEAFWLQIEKTERELEEILAGNLPCMPDEVPQRDDFVAVYDVLRNSGFAGGKRTTISKLLVFLPEMSYLKVRIILEVFAECGLCELKCVDVGNYYIKVPKIDGKKDLFSTPLMKKLAAAK